MSPVQWQTQHIPLAQGMQQKADPRALEAPALAVCKNAQFDEVGGIQKRKPYSAISGTLPSDVRRLAVYDGELVLFTKDKIYSYSQAGAEWVEVADYLAPKVTERSRFVRMPDQVECDRAELDGVAVYSWRDNGGESYLAALDATTGALIAGPTAIDRSGNSISKVRLVALNDRIVCAGVDSTNLFVLKMLLPSNLDSATAGEGFGGAWQYSYTCNGNFDIQKSVTDSAGFVLARTTDYEFGKVTGGASGAPTVTTINKVYAAAGSIAVAPRPASVAKAVIVRGTEGKADVIDWNTLADASMDNTVFAAAKSQVSAAWLSATSCGIFGSTAGTGPTFYGSTDYNTISDVGSTGTETNVCNEVQLASHVMVRDGVALAWVSFAENAYVSGMTVSVGFRAALQNTYFLLRSDGLVVAKSAPGLGAGHQTGGHLATVQNTTGSVYECCLGERRRVPLGDEASDGYAQRNPLHVSVELDSDEARRVGKSGETLYIAGGQVKQYDGEQAVEVGFDVYPWGIQGGFVVGGNLSAGSYAWKGTNRWSNAKGESERSTTATVAEATVASGDRGAIQVTMCPVTNKRGDVTPPTQEVWRTVVNPSPGAPFYLATDLDPSNTSTLLDNRYIENDPTVIWVSSALSDVLSDSDLTQRETNPENSGQLPNIAPPACSIILAGEERVFLAGIANDPHNIWYSQLRGEGDIAAFSDFLQVQVPADGGAITALAFLQEVLVVFKERAIYTLPGDGFDNIGGGQNYGPARLVSTDVGAENAESIGVTPDGIIFRSQKGWYMLNRGFGVEYIGAPVSDYDDDTLVAVHVLESQHQVRVVSTSRVLMFDTLVRQWSEWEESGSVGSVIWNGAHVLLTSNDIKQQGDYGSGDAYTMLIETAWVKLAGLNGFYRARRIGLLGELLKSSTVSIDVAYGYDETYVDEIDHQVDSGGSAEPLKLQQRMTRQKTDAIKVRVSEASFGGAASNEERIRLTGLSIEYGIKQGLRRLPAAQKQ